MKTKIYLAIFAFFSMHAFSQVGINTTAPEATLDVNGNMIIRQIPSGTSLSGYEVLAVNTANLEMSRLNPSLLGGNNTNSTLYAAKKTQGIALVNLGIFPAGFQAVNFVNAERTVGAPSLFSDIDNTYTIPSSGVYVIAFSFRYGSGIQAALLSNSPGVGIVRTRAGVSTLLDNRSFSGANLGLLSLTISESTVNSLYTLQAGDKISFGLTGASVLNVGLLGSSVASFYIYKVG